MSHEHESTGIALLDVITGRILPHSLTLIIGAPGVGKTVLAFQSAMHHAREGRQVVFLTAYSEPHEKLTEHMRGFSFFDPEFIGEQIELLSLKSAVPEGIDRVIDVVLRSLHGKRRPYLVLDGYRGLREALGPTSTQQLLSGLTSQMPFYDASVIVTAESDPHDPENFAEVTSADTLIALFHTHLEARTIRTLEVMKVRGKSYLRGLHGFDITSDGIVVYPRLSACLPATAPAPTARRYSFDLPEFDAMLGGGLPEFSSTMIMGDTGTGKSTLALQYIMAGAEQGERGLILALHDERVDVLQKAADLQIDLATHVESGRVEILEITPVEIDPYALAWRIREVVERHRPQRFVIDSVSDLEAAPGVQQSPRDYLFALNLYLRRAGVTTVMTYESGSMNQFDTPGQSLVRMPSAQNRILLQRVIRGDRFYRTCSVVHMQRSDHDTRIREFVIGPGGMTFRQLDDEGEDIAAEIA